MALADLDAAFRRFFDGVAGCPRPRRKFQHDSFTFPDPAQIRIERGAALEYLVGEKLLLFTSTARTRHEFAAQLPAFVGRVRQIFLREVVVAYVAELEHSLTEESHQVDA